MNLVFNRMVAQIRLLLQTKVICMVL